MSLVKICGITNAADALKAVELGANFIGFVFAESPRQADFITVKNTVRMIGNDVKTVGVFTEESERVLKIMDECKLDYAQLHGKQSEDFAKRIGYDRVIRVCRVSDENSINELYNYPSAKFYLLDTYKKGIPGGTGEVFNWDLAIKASEFGKPIFLSGGLNPDNIREAIIKVNPFAVDVSSGIEMSAGNKDHYKMEVFFKNVKQSNNA